MSAALKCSLCFDVLLKKSYRNVLAQVFPSKDAICEVLGVSRQQLQAQSKCYVCAQCFNKLNRLEKVNFELRNKLDQLRNEKVVLLQALRKHQAEVPVTSVSATELPQDENVTPSASGSGKNDLF